MLPASDSHRLPQFLYSTKSTHSGANDKRLELEKIARLLSAEQARIEPKYFYDLLGSSLFDAITRLVEYYPTRTEAQILRQHAAEMAVEIGGGATLVDLGAGNCEKAASLFAVLKPAHYVAVDISADYLQTVLMSLQRRYPRIEMTGVAQDFSSDLRLPVELEQRPRCLFYPGSSIGNFTPAEALKFLQQAHRESCGGNLLIGVDLVKARQVLEPAYDDALGVTAAFNLNVLLHLNALIGSNFDVRQWQHVALFNAAQSRIEMHLQAREALTVDLPTGVRAFAKHERIHTENSYKYTQEKFAQLLAAAGFKNTQVWTDDQKWFAVFLAHA